MRITSTELFLLLGVIAMGLAQAGFGPNPQAGFAFGIGMALPGMWEFQKWAWHRLAVRPDKHPQQQP